MRIILADLILYVHFIYVLGILVPIPLIIVGARKKWRFVRNLWFRRIHLGMILFVVVETLIGMICPLTEWEAALRGSDGVASAYAEGFISAWVSWILFYDLDPIWFAMIYFFVAAVIIALYIWIPPEANFRLLAPGAGKKHEEIGLQEDLESLSTTQK